MKFSIRRIATTLLAIAAGSLQSTHAADDAYQPSLPKISPLDGIIVLDLAHPKTGQIEDTNFRATITAFQGIINRTETTKVYFKSVPIRVFQTGDERDHMSELAGPGDPTELWLQEGLVPGTRVDIELDGASAHPVFDYLWENYGHLVKGKVLCNDATKDKNEMAARAAALCAATFEDALFVPESVDSYLTEKGIDLEVIADTREMEQIEAFEWSIEKYGNHPKRNRQVIAYVGDINPPVMWDYWVASYTFPFWLHKSGPISKDEVDKEFDLLLNTDLYPPGIPVIGPVEGGKVIQRIQRLGYTAVNGLLSNASVTASIPTEPSTFTEAIEPKVLDKDPNGVYLSFNGPDGDALDFLAYIGFKGMLQDPKTGEVPMGWRVNPYFIDLFPTLFNWFASQDPETIDLLGSMNNGGSSYTEAGEDGWMATYQNYIANSAGNLRHINYLGGMYSAAKREILGLDIDLCVTGYQGDYDMFDPEFKITNNTLFTNQIGRRGHPKVPLPGGEEAQETTEYLRKTIEKQAVDGEPLFIMARLPSECGSHAFSIVAGILEDLKTDTPKGRTVYLIPPRDFAASYKAWNSESQE